MNLLITTVVSAVTALIAVVVTNVLTRRREHEADWRRLKLAHYQQFVATLSAITEGRCTADAMRPYTDAVNAMSLIAPINVLNALRTFQEEISYKNDKRSSAEHDRLFNLLVRAIRADIEPSHSRDNPEFKFMLLGLPPEMQQAEKTPPAR
ncbi:hypothetical protein [Methylocystis rosea]|uniref:hypothetical protein n=1 Tax=Methylocystis rosea TaxID=173366 RepID=UPI0012EB2F62|nr:hypothetical protein [Methylocystis rosea]